MSPSLFGLLMSYIYLINLMHKLLKDSICILYERGCISKFS